jgi:hypothetical protein
VGPKSHQRGSGVGQLVTDSRFSMVDPFSYQVRSTGPEGSLPFFGEKPRIMLQSRLERGSGYPWCLHARVLAASRPIRPHPSFWRCPRVVVNPSAGQSMNPRALIGCWGVLCAYPFLPAGAFGLPSALHRPYDCDGSTCVVMGTCGQEEEKAHPAPGHHSVPEGPRPLRPRRHRSLPLEVGGISDGAHTSAVWDSAGRAA